MLLLVILLVSGALGTEDDQTVRSYDLIVENGVLMKVMSTNKSSGILDLSDLRIDKINVDCFNGLKGLKNLTMRLTRMDELHSYGRLPPLVFRELSELETLTLVETDIPDARWVFWGLTNLRLLNLTTSSVNIERGSFFGLKNNGVIEMTSNKQLELRSEHFEEPFPYVCVNMMDGIVHSVELFNNTTKVSTRSNYITRMVPIRHEILALDSMGIRGFHTGWYRIKTKSVRVLSLMRNNIKSVTRQMFTGLPTDLLEMFISYNQIEKIKRGTIVHSHLRKLYFNGNPLITIEPHAFDDTKLHEIVLSFDFMKTLPTSLETLGFVLSESNYVTSCISGL